MSTLEERTVLALESIATELKRANDVADMRREDIISCAEAAELCGVTRQTISVWIRTGVVHKVRKNGRTGVLVDELPYRRIRKKTP